MSSTEEDNALLRQSQEIGVREGEVGEESVVESVIRGEERVPVSGDRDDSDEASIAGSQNGTRQAVSGEVAETTGRGFGEKDVSEDEIVEAEVESCPESGYYHSATSDSRHDIEYLANKKGALSQKLNEWPALSSLV